MRIVPIGISILEEAERKPVDVCFGVKSGAANRAERSGYVRFAFQS